MGHQTETRPGAPSSSKSNPKPDSLLPALGQKQTQAITITGSPLATLGQKQILAITNPGSPLLALGHNQNQASVPIGGDDHLLSSSLGTLSPHDEGPQTERLPLVPPVTRSLFVLWS